VPIENDSDGEIGTRHRMGQQGGAAVGVAGECTDNEDHE